MPLLAHLTLLTTLPVLLFSVLYASRFAPTYHAPLKSIYPWHSSHTPCIHHVKSRAKRFSQHVPHSPWYP